jgi:hypothetical protein
VAVQILLCSPKIPGLKGLPPADKWFYAYINLCYTFNMQHTHWPQWADFLKKWGMEGFAAWLLEAGAPLAPVGAQLLYVGQPLFNRPTGAGLGALAAMLEDEEEIGEFVALLKEGKS